MTLLQQLLSARRALLEMGFTNQDTKMKRVDAAILKCIENLLGEVE